MNNKTLFLHISVKFRAFGRDISHYAQDIKVCTVTPEQEKNIPAVLYDQHGVTIGTKMVP